MQRIFSEIHKDANSNARLGVLSLPHGDVQTPAFMPVGTNGTVKGIYHDKVDEIGYKLILGNTYHLYLRPGLEVLEKFGGLHNFSHWNHNLLTDSGGFQVFSLSGLRKISEKGVAFQSHIDGSRHIFTPEKVVDIQKVIGSDIAMCLDVCTPPNIEYRAAKEAMHITHNWAERALKHREELGSEFRGNLFGIVQGNFYKDLRKESAEVLSAMDFPGIAIGGLSVGETPDQFKEFLAYTSDYVTKEKPRYVMGIGSPDYILEAVENGIDMFDCVLATRMARNGAVFTDDGVVTLKKAMHTFSQEPIESECTCTACTEYSRAYMHHLVKTNEMLGGMLATEHNLTYFYRLMEKIRKAIAEDRFSSFKKEYLARFYKR
ncbi:tRNA guanosine(34) transglycosylase Tgt [uncultured Sphaerochaeta sp.]|uniref:tRNA guanosine(34) transglycosylase Tgt n=1 Tax=uncultured Sphaerochaeta sp. TaxID=886478 RepID=UPI002A0A6C71|nr:tRNA guanosine(34) transglycosylase Tgt [uncultured Sphaerochaeta sp.]